VLLSIVAGIVLGVLSKLVDYVAPSWTGNSLGLWLLVAFLVALGARSWREAALRGCVALVIANAAYYGWRLTVPDNISLRFAARAFSFWTALAIPAGLVAGVAATHRREGLALPAGGFVGEAVVTALVGGRVGHAVAAGVIGAFLTGLTKWTLKGAGAALAAAAAVTGAVALREVFLV
jgi:hypothetical protein